MTIFRLIPATVAAWLLATAVVVADPWQPLHGLDVPSSIRRVTYGWVFDDFDAGADPVLATPLTASTVWANGVVDDAMPLIRTGLDLPMGKSLLTARLVAGQHKRTGFDGRLLADNSDLDGDGFADQLLWRRQVAGVADGGRAGTIGARLGLRWPSLGLALSYARRRERAYPTQAHFDFPTTSATVNATAETTAIYDLLAGQQLSERSTGNRLQLARDRQTLGFDFGGRYKAVGAAVGLGLEWDEMRDDATSVTLTRINGASFNQQATRDYRQNVRALIVALRLDGQHEIGRGRYFVWTGGASLKKPQTPEWRGTETLDFYDVDPDNPQISWNREPVLTKYARTLVEGRLGAGLRDEGPLFRYGFGLDWRALSDKASTRYQDKLTYRINNEGVPGQTPSVFLLADGSGDWLVEDETTVYEYGIGGGGRYAVNPYLGLMMGSRVGYRQTRGNSRETLVATQAVSGQQTSDDDVVDPVQIPYANFDVADQVRREAADTFIDLNMGFTFHINRADITTLFTLDDARDLAVVVEGVWRW